MYPSSTEYTLATNEDRINIYEEFDLTSPIGNPTVVAKREGKLLGFLSTNPDKERIIAGPIEVKLKNKAFVCLRLVEAYDNLMKMLGITSYMFYVDNHESGKWLEQVKESGLYTKIEETERFSWYKREL